MNISHRLLTVLSTLTTAVGLRAQVVTPNPAPTIIKTAPYTISAPGFYQLGANLTVSNASGNIITINASNVTLDFGGHYISGPVNSSSTLVGVYANEEGNVNIQNGTIAYCYQGVLLTGNGSSTSLNINQHVQNMLVSYCYACGIQLTNASNSAIANNRISFITGGTNINYIEGIYDKTGTGNIADSNIVTNVTTNIGLASGIAGALTNTASSLTVTNNRISNVTNPANPGGAIGVYEGVFVIGNTVNNVYQPIYTAGKYKDNLTSSTTDAFGGGTDAGGNN